MFIGGNLDCVNKDLKKEYMSQQSDKKDIIVSGFSNFGIKQLTPWLNSIDQCGFTGDILCVMYGSNPDMVEAKKYLKTKSNFIIIDGILTKTVVCDRFKDIYLFLKDKKEQYRYVFSTDASDVIFQLNPSHFAEIKLVNGFKLLCGSESILYKNETWGNQNMKNSFPSFYDFMMDKLVYNAGTITGNVEAICDLFKNIYEMSINTIVENPDQAAYNILIQTKYKDICYFSGIEDCYATQCNTTGNPRLLSQYGHLLTERPIFKNGIAYNSKMEKTCLLHQYQNVPGFYQEVLKTYE